VVIIDITSYTYDSMLKDKMERNMCITFDLSSMTMLLVDSRKMQDVETRKQRLPKLMNIANFILNNTYTVTKMAYNIFSRI